MTIKQLKTPLLSGTCAQQKRAELKHYYANTVHTYQSLFSLIDNDNAYYLRPEPLRHPLIFYFGHTATFYINKLMLGKFINKRINPKLEAICAVGVDEMSWDDLDSRHYDWPKVDEVVEYRRQVFTLVNNLIDTMEISLPICKGSLAWIILMGCEHERIHLETSSVIMRMLPLNDLTAHQDWPACDLVGTAPENKLLTVDGKTITLGKPGEDQTYGWDNEYGQLKVAVEPFKASQFLVSNGEFIEFMEAGGYQNSACWSEEGQQWLAFKGAKMPRFWLKKNDQYWQRNLLNEIPLPLNWPVEVNYLEAKAFCNWKNSCTEHYIRLPTEAEWYCLQERADSDLINGQQAPGNINLAYWASSSPVEQFSGNNFFDLFGNVWQWTESAIDGFEGFQVDPLYDDFSTPTFDGQHNLIKGGSWISTGNEALKHSRYAFRRHFFQHAGFRYIESTSPTLPTIPVNEYVSDKTICAELEAHFGEDYLGLGNYSVTLAGYILEQLNRFSIPKGKLLDLGCSVGRCSFELSPYFKEIDSVDFSAQSIPYPVQLQQGKTVRYALEKEGELVDFKSINLNSAGLNESYRNIHFKQGDASNLKTTFGDYDVIIAQQVLELHYDPQGFLDNISSCLKKGGILILVSAYEVNPQINHEKRFSGKKVNGENLTGFDAVQQRLSEQFLFVASNNITKLSYHCARKFTVTNQHITLWEKLV
ncbi:MAG: 5-histidylcysteine sulfoxide synthase/putative 4-mercaptohistidine N1-methyltransferase [Psychromonas sp.]|jgi:5-histidylcysteine sulfoxide synthase/putative 4-mercaptohistidine N1-methyltranferase|uniref:5-histidylcysteine sulfoxide synthase n=1 Tax=Psychromonas sp. TaxID=1884585 RepID=UPI0039E70049